MRCEIVVAANKLKNTMDKIFSDRFGLNSFKKSPIILYVTTVCDYKKFIVPARNVERVQISTETIRTYGR